MHARGVGGIGILWMQILEEDPGMIKGFDMLEETLHVGLRGLGRSSIQSVHAHDIGRI